MKLQTNEDVLRYINEELKDFEGYVQLSHRPIDKDKDIFYDGKTPQVKNEEGFIYEAHFANNKQSISIRQINDAWVVSVVDIATVPEDDIKSYASDVEGLYRIKMAQIWVEEADELCEGMHVKSLKKVVFAGFEKGDAK